MEFGKWMILESLFMIAAGLTFFGGARGLLISAFVISVVNAFGNKGQNFMSWEIPLLIGTGGGILLLYLVNRKAGEFGVVNGLAGNLLSLVLFAVLVTPVLAIILWILVVGTGIIPPFKRMQVLWGIAPTLLRIILGISWIVYGNILFV